MRTSHEANWESKSHSSLVLGAIKYFEWKKEMTGATNSLKMLIVRFLLSKLGPMESSLQQCADCSVHQCEPHQRMLGNQPSGSWRLETYLVLHIVQWISVRQPSYTGARKASNPTIKSWPTATVLASPCSKDEVWLWFIRSSPSQDPWIFWICYKKRIFNLQSANHQAKPFVSFIFLPTNPQKIRMVGINFKFEPDLQSYEKGVAPNHQPVVQSPVKLLQLEGIKILLAKTPRERHQRNERAHHSSKIAPIYWNQLDLFTPKVFDSVSSAPPPKDSFNLIHLANVVASVTSTDHRIVADDINPP